MQQLRESSAVQLWMHGLRLTTEPECMCVLQTKAIQQPTTDHDLDMCRNTLLAVQAAIDDVIQGARATAKELLHLDKLLDKCLWKQVASSCLRLARRLRRRLHKWNAYLPGAAKPAATLSLRLHHDQVPLFDLCSQLTQLASQLVDDGESAAEVDNLQVLLDCTADRFASFIDSLLGILVRSMVESINEIDLARLCGRIGSSPVNTLAYQPLPVGIAGSVIQILGRLSLEGGRMCRLLCREGGMQVLIHKCCPLDRRNIVVPEARSTTDDARLAVWVQALRALSMVCCVPETVLELQKMRGVEFLTSILCSQGYVEEVRAEAAGVIAQITSPALGCVRHLTSFLENMEALIQALTDLCHDTSCSDTFLLGAAALANATFADPLSLEYMLQYDTLQVLTNGLQSPRTNSLFAKDQVATVLANMATSMDCFKEILHCNGIELLVGFLSECQQSRNDTSMNDVDSEALHDVELSACERLQQKAAIALSRLSRDFYTARLIVQSNGIPRLVELCRDSKKRNRSGAVLVACLAALRKIIGMCGGAVSDFISGEEAISGTDLTATELRLLVTPKLMDSYMLCCKLNDEYSM